MSQDDFRKTMQDSNVPQETRVEDFLRIIDDLNNWLYKTYWPLNGKLPPTGGVWVVGEEQGLECRRGTLWYGGGKQVRLGRGF